MACPRQVTQNDVGKRVLVAVVDDGIVSSHMPPELVRVEGFTQDGGFWSENAEGGQHWFNMRFWQAISEAF